MTVHALISALILSALALDLAAPPGTAAWLIYFVPLWAAGHWYGRRGGYRVTAVCTALLLLAGLRSLTGIPWPSELTLRLAGAAVLWGTAVSIFRRRQAAAVLRQQWQARVRQCESQTRQFMACQEAERRRLARQLHDELSQLLAAICMRLHMARELGAEKTRLDLDECLEATDQAIELVREMSLDLCPSMLDDFGLLAALRNYLERQAERTGLSVNLVSSSSWKPLPSELENACFRVVQEALTNVIRHASAQQVQVELRQDAEAVQLTIHDDGVGLDPHALEPRPGQPGNLGLTAIRQRVELLGGFCHIGSAPGQGTVIQVRLPLDDSRAGAFTLGPARWPDDDTPCPDSADAEVSPSFPGRRP